MNVQDLKKRNEEIQKKEAAELARRILEKEKQDLQKSQQPVPPDLSVRIEEAIRIAEALRNE